MDLYNDALRWVIESLPVLMRVASFLLAIPIFGQGVPSVAKVGLAAFITALIVPNLSLAPIPDDLGAFTFLIVEEVVVGLAMGLIVTMLFSAIYLAGQLIDVPMGFGMVNVVDPQTGMQIPIVAQFKFALAILILFAVDGHHALIGGLARSFSIVPIGFASAHPEVTRVALNAFGTLFTLALRIALPIVAALFIADVALGIVARAVPQVNVFFVGIPLKIGLGIVLMIIALPVFGTLMATVLAEQGEMVRALEALLRALALRE